MSGQAFPILTVADVAVARAFYERLGFAQTYQFPPEGEPAFLTMERHGSALGLGAGGAQATDRFALWIDVDDVDATYAAMAEAGARVEGAPQDQPWGERVAQLRDPDGNLVHLGAQAADPGPPSEVPHH